MEGNVGKSNFHWLNLRDDHEPELYYIAQGLITEDGHPMYCPANRDWFICDTYPDKEGIRTTVPVSGFGKPENRPGPFQNDQ
jgi:hypothetical protein